MALSHHDPGRTDDALDQIVESIRSDLKDKGSPMHVFAAADGQVVELDVSSATTPKISRGKFSTMPATAPAVKDSSVLMGVSDAGLALVLMEAARVEGVRTTHALDAASTVRMAKSARPGLILLEDQPAGIDGLSVCRRLRSEQDLHLREMPIVMVAGRERTSEGIAAGVTQWLITPFSVQYARAQIQAWLWRSACRWIRAALPADEEKRLTALRELSILDTQSEQRFDRITRVAAAVGDVPIALVSLVDHDRQWFKSCHGLSVTETSRELSFCGHVVLSRAPVIVPDTLLDDRFADNPLLSGDPRARFFAGSPIVSTECICMITSSLVATC